MPSLDELRAEIDVIDRQLHELLIRRVAIGHQVAEAKSKEPGPAFRPAREAQIMRRLLDHNRPPLAAQTLGRVWRSIMSANLSQQLPFTARVFAPNTAIRDLARDYCTAATRVESVETASDALEDGADAQGHICILPMIGAGEAGRWWPLLLDQKGNGRNAGLQSVVARLPFFETGPESPRAMIVAAQTPEASGQDRTIFAVNCKTPPSGAAVLDSWRNGSVWHAVELEGFHERPPADMRSVPWKRLGAYAVPVRVTGTVDGH